MNDYVIQDCELLMCYLNHSQTQSSMTIPRQLQAAPMVYELGDLD